MLCSNITNQNSHHNTKQTLEKLHYGVTNYTKLQQQHIWLRGRLYTWLIMCSLLRTPPLIVKSQLCASPAELISSELTGGAYCFLICLWRSCYVTAESKMSGCFFLRLEKSCQLFGVISCRQNIFWNLIVFTLSLREFELQCVSRSWLSLLWPNITFISFFSEKPAALHFIKHFSSTAPICSTSVRISLSVTHTDVWAVYPGAGCVCQGGSGPPTRWRGAGWWRTPEEHQCSQSCCRSDGVWERPLCKVPM